MKPPKMTNAQFTQLLDHLATPQPVQPVVSESSRNNSLILAVVTAAIISIVTSYISRGASTTSEVAEFRSRIEILQDTTGEVKAELKSLRSELATARIDPFTGAMGVALERRIEERIRNEHSSLMQIVEANRADIRAITSSYREPSQ